jgi:hypothetical protein
MSKVTMGSKKQTSNQMEAAISKRRRSISMKWAFAD